jgi:Spy/CpxP family protein refolding chaperone
MKKLAILFALIFVGVTLLVASDDGQPSRRPPRSMAREILNLTPEQEAKLEEFRKMHQEGREVFQDQMHKMRLELRDLMKDPKADRKRIDGLIDEMSRIRAEHLKARIQHRDEIRKVLTPEQLEKLDSLKSRIRDRVARQHFFRKDRRNWGFRDRMHRW